MLIGLTGGIATGKTTVINFLKELGAKVIETDLIAKEIVKPNTAAYKKIVNRWGKEILNENNEIDRKKLASIVFANEKERKILEEITHPQIATRLIELLKEVNKNEIVIVDVPLLFETGIKYLFNKIIVVYADELTQIQRLIMRDNISYDEAKRRIAAQIKIDDKIKYADYIIDATKPIDEVKIDVIKLWNELLKGG